MKTHSAFVLYLALSVSMPPASAQPPREPKGLVYEHPAEGCPTKLPTVSSARELCHPLAQAACRSTPVCKWFPESDRKKAKDKPGDCYPESDAVLSPPSFDSTQPSPIWVLPIRLMSDTKVDRLIERAYADTARKRYSEALKSLTSAIALDRERGSSTRAYALRALVLEQQGSAQKAIGDYCKSLAYANDYKYEQLARARIEQIAFPDRDRLPMPVVVMSGFLSGGRGKVAPAPLAVETPEEYDYVLKFANERTNREEFSVYVRAGSTFKTAVPYGTYRVRGAYGAIWYGSKLLFGEETKYFKLETLAGDDVLRFFRDGNIARGHRIKLLPQKDGNLRTPQIDKGDF